MPSSEEFCFNANNNEEIRNLHKEKLEKFCLPSWLPKVCPMCKEELPITGIRQIGLKLNSRNIGDICVEFYCDICKQMDTLYYRKEANNIYIFTNILSDLTKIADQKPLLEDEMYEKKYNNLLDGKVKTMTKEFSGEFGGMSGLPEDIVGYGYINAPELYVSNLLTKSLEEKVRTALEQINWHILENISKIQVEVSIPTIIIKNNFNTSLLELDLSEDAPLMEEFGDKILNIVQEHKIGTPLSQQEQNAILTHIFEWIYGTSLHC